MDARRRAFGATGSATRLAAAVTLGVLIVHALPALPSWRWLLPATLPALLPWRWRRDYAVMLLALLWTVWQAGQWMSQRWPPARHGEEVTLRGYVASLPAHSEGGGRSEPIWRFQFRPDNAALPLMRVSWYRADTELRGGECWQLTLRVRTPHGSVNPGAFDYEGWLFRQHIGAVATVRGAERCPSDATRDGPPQAVPFWLRWRQRVLDHLHDALPGHPGLPLLAALAIGDDSGLRHDQWDAFRATGTTHLVAVSGFNVAIVAGFAWVVARWFWALCPALCRRLPAQKLGMIAAAIMALGYAFAAGWEPPVQRAAVMLLLLLMAGLLDRLRQPWPVLAMAWSLLLLIDPLSLAAPGLWLSFAAVATIFYVSSGRIGRAALGVEAVRVQLALSVSLIPLSLWFFQGVALAGAGINLLAVPLVGVLTPLAMVGVALSMSAWAGDPPLLGWVASALSELERGLVWLARHVDLLWWAANPAPLLLVTAGVGLMMLLAPRGLPLRGPGLLCLLPLLWPSPSAVPAAPQVTVLDVGQGLAVVVRTASHVLLYDTGPAFDDAFDAGESVVVPYLLAQGLPRVDRLVISHDDQDHIGGLGAVRRRLSIVDEIGAPDRRPCREGESWDWDGVHFAVLHPAADTVGTDNDRSCVLAIGTPPHRVLLSGDIEQAAERRLIDQHAAGLASDLLIAPHHGSRSSSSVAFVQAVAPAEVVYSAAWRSYFGHPRPEVVARYRAVGARQWTSGVSGALQLTPSATGWTVTEQRRLWPHWWNAPAEP